MKSLFKTVALITFFSILTRIIGFFFRIYLSRTIGAEGLGMYQVAFSVFMVLLTMVSSGIPLIISRLSAGYRVKKDGKSEGALVSTALIFGLVISVVICLVVYLFKNLFAGLFTDHRCIEILIVLIPSLVTSSVYCVFRGALWGQGNYFALCISELYEQVLRIFICVLIVGSSLSAIENALNVAWSLTFACIGSMVFVMLLFFYYGGKLKKPSKRVFKPLFKESLPITGIRVAGSFIQPLVGLIIPARLISIGYTSSQAMSLYGVAVGMTLPLLFVPTTIIGSLSTALIPDISTALAKNDTNYIQSRARTSILFAIFVSALFIPAYMGVGELAGLFLYDNVLSGTLLQAAAWIMLPMGITNISSALLNSLGLEVKSFINYVIGAVFMFIAMWFLPGLIGINALVWGMGISFVVTALLNIRMIKKKTKIKLKLFKPLFILSLLIVPSAALSSFVTSLCNNFFPSFISICLGGGIAVLSFVMLCAVFNVVDIQFFWNMTKKKFTRKTKVQAKT